MNNKGFTLIELLGVIVILVLILLVAIPNISSTYERNKNKINEQKKEVILSAVEIYANRYKKNFNYDDFLEGNCGIPVRVLLDKELITSDELKNSENADLYIKFDDSSTEKAEDVLIKYDSNGKYFFEKSTSTECVISDS